MSLPSQRQLLTLLISSLAETTTGPPLPDTPQKSEQRDLLFTLHVVFPTLLLPALDLLDRNLVARVVLVDSSAIADPNDGDEAGSQPQKHGRGVTKFYTVKSLASTVPARERQKKRHQDVLSTGAAAQKYIVRLDAWHCSCPSFTLDAFSHVPQHQQQPRHVLEGSISTDQAPDPEELEQENQFGGWSLDGVAQAGGSHDVPCCKHMLACLLAHVWKGQRGVNVEERIVTVEEMAGIVANM